MRTATRIVVLLVTTLALAACSSTDEGTSGQADGDLGWTRLTSQELSEMMDAEDVYLVNVHVPYEGEIPGTDEHIPYTDIASQLDQLPSGGPKLVIYCRSGNMSTTAAQEMVAAGASDFYELEGGYQAWQAAGLPFDV